MNSVFIYLLATLSCYNIVSMLFLQKEFIMFLSINRKIIYSILGLFLLSSLIFISTFYTAYTSKIETDQLASIQRNLQYNNLFYRNINMIRELKELTTKHPNLDINEKDYKNLYDLVNDTQQSEFLLAEQKNVAERTKTFDKQYEAIKQGVTIIGISALLLTLIIFFIGYLISRWILNPITTISKISEQISKGNMTVRIPLRQNIKYFDELDKLALTFNMMLDNIQNMILQIKDKENFLQALIDSIPDGIRVIDENYQILIANKSYYKLSGETKCKHKACYKSSFKIDAPCNSNNSQCPLNEILKKGKKNLSVIQQFINNPQRYLSINAAPLILDNSHKYIIESIRDLSKDIDFSHQQKLSSLGFLSSSIAHEIKNHLGALRIVIEHLIDKYYTNISDDREDKKMVQMLHSELVNAISVPERLLKLTRNHNSVNSEIDCASSISEILSLLDYEAKSKGVDISLSAPKKSAIIKGDETDFKIAVINIILNAIKATKGQGILKIDIKQSSNNDINISFNDNGVGIPQSNIANIFNPYFSEGKQGGANKGSGLGLAITKSIVEKFGGKIYVTSTEGKGSCFTLSFPANKKLAKK